VDGLAATDVVVHLEKCKLSLRPNRRVQDTQGMEEKRKAREYELK